ncbi:MAG: glycoside hydrolase family 92 protein, partial [Bacteroidales bacterium]|nr:glycoside hydrolase family 92 protein [Bacteroidales bacterium]
FDPYKYGANGGYPFTEGNAWQYYWYVPHQVEDLIALTGGQKAFCRKLDEFFTSTQTSGAKNDNASGLVGLYAHGNEPSHHVAYLYALAGQPQKTQQLVNHIARTLYNTSSSGYAGNDDCGEMSAWYVFSALGFYPLNPVGGSYVLGSPLVDKAILQLPSGKQLRIEVERPSREAIYVRSISLNGKAYKRAVIHHDDLLQGGVLRFVMTTKPSGSILASNLSIF